MAGIGGLSLGVLLLVFRGVIQKNIFPVLNQRQAYQILNRIILLVTVVAIAGIGAWLMSEILTRSLPINSQAASETNLKNKIAGDWVFKTADPYSIDVITRVAECMIFDNDGGLVIHYINGTAQSYEYFIVSNGEKIKVRDPRKDGIGIFTFIINDNSLAIQGPDHIFYYEKGNCY